MELQVRVSKRLKEFTLEVAFGCAPGEILAVVGPSGAGKTTLLRILAGLEQPDSGVISSGPRAWVDTGAGLHTPPQQRRLGYVFQEATLFPHLTVLQNVSFAASGTRLPEELLRRFGIWHLRQSKPHRISGGERQRCAICQALARGPAVLLLDEPFSALDAITRRKLREQLGAMKRELNIPIVHVTHDIREALLLADDILPMVKGRVERKWMVQFLLKDRFQGLCTPFDFEQEYEAAEPQE